MNVAVPNQHTNFITFFNAANTCIGEIHGNGANGTVYKTTGCDYAEYLLKELPDEAIVRGDIVGITGGKISRRTIGAALQAVVSSAPAAVGNMPHKGEEHRHSMIAFLGQAQIKVKGPVKTGDFILPSGRNDGVGVAVSPSAIDPQDLDQIVGQAWESSDDPGVKKINALIGISPTSKASTRIVELVQDQGRRLRQLEDRLAAIEQSGTKPVGQAQVGLAVPTLVGAMFLLSALNLWTRRSARKEGV
jgi:hypothetical protein